jgi:hypothetical protein
MKNYCLVIARITVGPWLVATTSVPDLRKTGYGVINWPDLIVVLPQLHPLAFLLRYLPDSPCTSTNTMLFCGYLVDITNHGRERLGWLERCRARVGPWRRPGVAACTEKVQHVSGSCDLGTT